jgi:polyferredoxin
MDACNAVMIKTKRPKGLIRYSSENGLKSGKSFKLKPRNIAYTGVLIGILIFFTVSIFNRSVTQTTILRARNIEYQITARGEVANLYTIDILNKSNKDIQAQIKLKSPAGRIEIFGNDLKLKANSETKASMLVYINNNTMKTSNVPVEFEVYSDNRLTETINLNFLGPEK